jgi:23S rRNA (guanosine2251-2'-O)-methyltransferase
MIDIYHFILHEKWIVYLHNTFTITKMQPQSRLDGVKKFNVHTCFQTNPLEKLKQISKAFTTNVHIMLLNTDGNMNIAMTIRTAAVMGCSKIWIVGKRSYDARPEVGAKHYIEIEKFDSIDPSTFFTERDIQPVILEQGGIPLEEYSFKPYFSKTICFVIGSESKGIPSDFLTQGFPIVTISQYGLIRSLNMSIAGGMVIYEYLKQWRSYRLNT